jgi:hypothetical protein
LYQYYDQIQDEIWDAFDVGCLLDESNLMFWIQNLIHPIQVLIHPESKCAYHILKTKEG